MKLIKTEGLITYVQKMEQMLLDLSKFSVEIWYFHSGKYIVMWQKRNGFHNLKYLFLYMF